MPNTPIIEQFCIRPAKVIGTRYRLSHLESQLQYTPDWRWSPQRHKRIFLRPYGLAFYQEAPRNCWGRQKAQLRRSCQRSSGCFPEEDRWEVTLSCPRIYRGKCWFIRILFQRLNRDKDLIIRNLKSSECSSHPIHLSQRNMFFCHWYVYHISILRPMVCTIYVLCFPRTCLHPMGR